jgi:hypothetical protein
MADMGWVLKQTSATLATKAGKILGRVRRTEHHVNWVVSCMKEKGA